MAACCPHCMRPSFGEICSHCGGNLRWQAPATQLPVGTLLRGSDGRTYQLGAAKGQGGFGITYVALDTSTNQRMAIKEYYPTQCATRDHLHQVIPATGHQDAYQGGMDSFLEEARTLAAVGALPSVVSVRDFFRSNGTAYIVMEFVDGQSLETVVKQRRRIPREQLFPLLPPLMRDLGLLHQKGIIHRDISPDNLILTPSGQLKLLDFGSARNMEDGKTMTVLLKGGYSPLEQYQGKGQGAFTDLYALAGTIYFCLTGTVPPTAIDRITEDELLPPNQLGAGLTDREQKTLMWGLELIADHRPQRTEAFSNALLGTNFPVPATEVREAVPQDPPVKHTTTQKKTTTHKQTTQHREKPARKKGKLLIPALVAMLALVLAGAGILFAMGSDKTNNTGFTYRIRSGEAEITGYSGSKTDLTIPSVLEGMPVTSLQEGALKGRRNLVSVTVPDSVRVLAPGAIQGCTSLELLTLQGSRTRAERGSIENCGRLRVILASGEDGYDRLEPVLDSLENVLLCYTGQDLGTGDLQSVLLRDEVIYGLTDQNTAVVLSLPQGMDSGELPLQLEGRGIYDLEGQRLGSGSGSAENGLTYRVENGGLVITGYLGSQADLVIPRELEGFPVTVLGEDCFQGNTQLSAVTLPDTLTAIRAGAFAGSSLTTLYTDGTPSVDPTAFRDCAALRCVLGREVTRERWYLPEGCLTGLHLGMDTGAGTLQRVWIEDNGVIYGITDRQEAVLMHVPASITNLQVPNQVDNCRVTWTYPEIDLNHEPQIRMAAEMGFPHSLLFAAEWKHNSFGDFSHSWLTTCVLCTLINDERASGQRPVEPDQQLVQAAMIRAGELAEIFETQRPNGQSEADLIDSLDIDWINGNCFRQRFPASGETYDADFQDSLDSIVETFTPRADSGRDYTLLGVAMWEERSKDMIYSATFGLTQE